MSSKSSWNSHQLRHRKNGTREIRRLSSRAIQRPKGHNGVQRIPESQPLGGPVLYDLFRMREILFVSLFLERRCSRPGITGYFAAGRSRGIRVVLEIIEEYLQLHRCFCHCNAAVVYLLRFLLGRLHMPV